MNHQEFGDVIHEAFRLMRGGKHQRAVKMATEAIQHYKSAFPQFLIEVQVSESGQGGFHLMWPAKADTIPTAFMQMCDFVDAKEDGKWERIKDRYAVHKVPDARLSSWG